MRGKDATRTEREIIRLTYLGLDWATLSERTGRALQAVLPFDHACWHTVDPVSMLFTGVTKDNLDDESRLPHHEYALADVNQWAALARAKRPAAILSEATAGEPQSSPRFRELLRPRGIADELRGSFLSSGTCWGACGIYRDAGRPDFTPAEAALLARVGGHLADGFRRALLLAARPGTSPRGPGIVLFDEHGAVVSIDPVAAAHLDAVVDRMPRPRADPEVPYAVRAVAERARAAVHDAAPPGVLPERASAGEWPSARARVRTADGRWLTLHGTTLGPGSAVLVEPSTPVDLWPLVAEAYRFTAREREIVVRCLRGASTDEIAAAMVISAHTVQQHLKSIFDKVGVRSRRELVARVFHDHYWEPVWQARTPGARGGFA